MKLTAENWEKLIRSNPNSGSVAHIWCEEIGGWLAPDEKMLKSFISSLLQAFFEDLAGASGKEKVGGYYRHNGIYVKPYYLNNPKKLKQEIMEKGRKWLKFY